MVLRRATVGARRHRNEHPVTASEDLVQRALAATPIVDGHNDLPTALRGKAEYSVDGLDAVRPELHTDIPRLVEGGVGGQFWSVYVPSSLSEPEAVVSTLEQIDAVYRLVARYPETFQLAYTADDVERAFREKRIASLFGVEGGHSIAGSLGVLRSFARLGVRYVTLTHNDNTSWADSATDEPGVGGLDADGLAIVAELNRLGILVDLSHTSAATQKAAIAASTAPVIFSHSSTRALSSHPRNVDDDVLALLPGNGGVIQITFVPYFLSEELGEWARELEAVRTAAGLAAHDWQWPATRKPASVTGLVKDPEAPPATAPEVDRWLSAHPKPTVTIDVVADHVEHAREVAGIDHVGLGGDYDGVDIQPVGLEDVSGYPRLLTALADRGWSQADLEALTGRNVIRVLRDAESVATNPLWPEARVSR